MLVGFIVIFIIILIHYIRGKRTLNKHDLKNHHDHNDCDGNEMMPFVVTSYKPEENRGEEIKKYLIK